ncbi:MAG: PhoH family protein [Pseudomonadota bacterium]|nr:PhoH family protein [Pseudomonadota bacterium]
MQTDRFLIREHAFGTPEQPADNRRLARLCGPLDAHLRSIESALGVRLSRRDAAFRVEGPRESIASAVRLLDLLYEQADRGLDERDLQLALLRLAGPPRAESAGTAATDEGADPDAEPIVLHTRHSDLVGRTPNQVRYLQQILKRDISFGIGPAGTGKTFLAVACAVDALERQGVQRIVLTRPAVEAGERLGFLPGDLAQKVDPYLRPLFDALHDLMGPDRVAKAFEKQLIEIAPLAFMRGRTLSHAFVILDEAQNSTREQMKMFLTRIGYGSRCVVNGDTSQIDLPSGVVSGLIDAEQVLQGVPGIGFTHFDASDVVRHPLVARIVEAYDLDRTRSSSATTPEFRR